MHVASSEDVVNLHGTSMWAKVSDEGRGVVVVVGGDFGEGVAYPEGGEEFGGGDFVGRCRVKLGVGGDEASGLGVGTTELVGLILKCVVELLVSVGGASVGNVGRYDDEVNIAIANSNSEKTRRSREDGNLLASDVGLDIFNKVGGGISPYLTSKAGMVGGAGTNNECSLRGLGTVRGAGSELA